MNERELRDIIRRTVDDNRDKDAKWIAHEIVCGFHPPGVEVSDFDRICAYGFVRYLMRSESQRDKLHDVAADDGTQLSLPGFVHVRRKYYTERIVDDEKRIIAVPVEEMTGDEILAKVAELRATGIGCFEHANELLRYHDQRMAVASGAP